MKKIILTVFIVLNIFSVSKLFAQGSAEQKKKITATMLKATKFMAENVSENGGYLSHYLPDMSRQWGEMEAYPTMVWVQYPGTVNMGATFLDAYSVTGNEYYYKQAKKAAQALIWGQLPCGGWNYFINFGGLKSTLKWYNTIGKNGWRLEEYQHYYGNATFDDETTTGAAFFLLRLYLTKQDPVFLNPLHKAIQFILESQYPLGGWPQRYPLRHDFPKNGHADYTSFYTFNDNVTWQNIKFLVTCYATLNYHNAYYSGGNTTLLNAIRRGMSFFLITQGPLPYAGWGAQYSMDLEPSGARSYEPAAVNPLYTTSNIEILLKFYEMTGDRRYLQRIPDAIEWLKEARLSNTVKKGVYLYPEFVDSDTGNSLYTHRTGSNVVSGHYYVDHDSTNTLVHYGNFHKINFHKLENNYRKISKEKSSEITKNSPIKPGDIGKISLINRYDEVKDYLRLPVGLDEATGDIREKKPRPKIVKRIIKTLDDKGRWLVTGLYTSHSYAGEPQNSDADTDKYMTTHVGDKYDTSPYPDESNQKYISTAAYMKKMQQLISYLKADEER